MPIYSELNTRPSSAPVSITITNSATSPDESSQNARVDEPATVPENTAPSTPARNRGTVGEIRLGVFKCAKLNELSKLRTPYLSEQAAQLNRPKGRRVVASGRYREGRQTRKVGQVKLTRAIQVRK